MIYERTEKLKHSDTVRCASHSLAHAVSLALAARVCVCASLSLFLCVSLCFCTAEGIAVCFSFSTTAVAVAFAVAVAAVAIVCAAAAAAALLFSSLHPLSGCICWTLSSSGTKRWYHHGRQPYRRLQPRKQGQMAAAWPRVVLLPPLLLLLIPLLVAASWQRMRPAGAGVEAGFGCRISIAVIAHTCVRALGSCPRTVP